MDINLQTMMNERSLRGKSFISIHCNSISDFSLSALSQKRDILLTQGVFCRCTKSWHMECVIQKKCFEIFLPPQRTFQWKKTHPRSAKSSTWKMFTQWIIFLIRNVLVGSAATSCKFTECHSWALLMGRDSFFLLQISQADRRSTFARSFYASFMKIVRA